MQNNVRTMRRTEAGGEGSGVKEGEDQASLCKMERRQTRLGAEP